MTICSQVGTLFTFDIEPQYAGDFFVHEQMLGNFCVRSRIAFPSIKQIEICRDPNKGGTQWIEYVTDESNAIWPALFEFYCNYSNLEFSDFHNKYGSLSEMTALEELKK